MIRKISSLLALLYFSWAISLQWNDPDPIWWSILYGFSALSALLAFFDRIQPRLQILAILFFIVYSAILLQRVPWAKGNILGNEEAREGFGVLISAVWSLLLIRYEKKLRR